MDIMMQTFLPYSDFKETAKILDYRRLGKQRVEAMQIINCIKKPNRWINHPAVKMWIGYVNALKLYHNVMIEEWIERGYNNTMKIYSICNKFIVYPNWLGDESFHLSHQSKLVQKNPKYYRKYFPNVQDDLNYIWPT